MAPATGLGTDPGGPTNAKTEPSAGVMTAKNSVPAAPVVKKEPDTPWWHAGETLDFSASMAKLNNVANLQIRTGERRDFLGKSVWHMLAVAHT